MIATEFLDLLSNLVHDTVDDLPFVFRRKLPSSLDTVLYGHLVLHLGKEMPDSLLGPLIMKSHNLLLHNHICHEAFQLRNERVIRRKERTMWSCLFEGWGVERGKRTEDCIGVAVAIGAILTYYLFDRLKA